MTKGQFRREKILQLITDSSTPLTGTMLAKEVSVSRQIVVQDISKLKDAGYDIIATSRGYIINRPAKAERIFKFFHSDEQIREELETIVALGGAVKDVFVWHKIYGKISADINIVTQEDIDEYIRNFREGRSSPLKNVTSEYHYHTVTAPDTAVLDKIAGVLDEKHFLVHN